APPYKRPLETFKRKNHCYQRRALPAACLPVGRVGRSNQLSYALITIILMNYFYSSIFAH
ncbi:MAG: hypothetical protein PHW15_02855, partial [Patescibacteria group bacterium]|nr:hypothetical protein [Patescibacteria group bacterium]